MGVLIRRPGILAAVAMFLLPLVSAGPVDAVSNAFSMFYSWMQMTQVMFGITFIFLLVLFYGIFAAGLSRVLVFKSGSTITRPGKMVALSLAVLATIGILFVIGSSPGESMRRILNAMGSFAAIAFSLLIFGASYLNFKEDKKTWPLVFVTTGLGMITYGLLVDSQQWFSLGWGFLIIGILWFLFDNQSKSAEDDAHPTGGTVQGEPEGESKKDHAPKTVSPSDPGVSQRTEQFGKISGRVIDERATLAADVDFNMLASDLADVNTPGVKPYLDAGRVKVKRQHHEEIIGSADVDVHGRFTIRNVPRHNDIIVFIDNPLKDPPIYDHTGSVLSRPPEAHADKFLLNLVSHDNIENVIIAANRVLKKRARKSPVPSLKNRDVEYKTLPFNRNEILIGDEGKDEADIKYPAFSGPPPPENMNTIINLSAFLPVENQGNTAACAAFAAGSVWEFHNNVIFQRDNNQGVTDDASRLSKFSIYATAQKSVNPGKHVTISRAQAVRALQKSGAALYSVWEDTEENIGNLPKGKYPQELKENMERHKIAGAYTLERSRESMLAALHNGHPILYGMVVGPGFIDIKNPYLAYHDPNVLASDKPHAFVIVGYTPLFAVDKNHSLPAFRIRNSWGKEWGNEGYCWVTEETLMARTDPRVYPCGPPLVIDKQVINRSGEGAHLNIPKNEKENIVKILKELMTNELEPGQSLKWKDREKKEKIKALVRNLKKLREYTPLLGRFGKDADNEEQMLITYLEEVLRKYENKDVGDLAHVRDEDVNTLVGDLLHLFRESNILPYIKAGDHGLQEKPKEQKIA